MEGPMRLNPGPTLPTQVSTEDMVVIKSNPLREISREPVNTTKM